MNLNDEIHELVEAMRYEEALVRLGAEIHEHPNAEEPYYLRGFCISSWEIGI